MKSSYRVVKLGDFLEETNERNSYLENIPLLGISNEKKFIASIANIVGTDLSSYKIVNKNQFAYITVTSRNGDKISVALLSDYEKCIVSSSYITFKVKDNTKLDPQYLLLWFKRNEFDRYSRFKSHGSTRETFDWDDMCNIDFPLPPLEEQVKIVEQYNVISKSIEIKQAINDNLLEQIRNIYNQIKSIPLIHLSDIPTLKEIKSGINKYEGQKQYFATGDIDFLLFSDTYQKVKYDERPSRANMQPIENSVWFAKMQNTKKLLWFDSKSANINKLILSTGFFGIKIDPKFLYYLISFMLVGEFETQKDKYATGTTQLSVNSSILNKVEIPFEEAIATKYNKIYEKIINNIASNNKQIEKLNKLKYILIERTGMLQ